MRDECEAIGMQPVCDHHAYCESAARVIYFGQGAKHLSQWTARNTASSWPDGWVAARMARRFTGDQCMWTGLGNGVNALCDDGQGSHYWATLTLDNGPRSFMCGRLLPATDTHERCTDCPAGFFQRMLI